jgi:iron(III) transport system permease protein
MQFAISNLINPKAKSKLTYKLVLFLFVFTILAPIILLFINALSSQEDGYIWAHISSSLLRPALSNTFLLICLTSFFSTLWGLSLAVLTSFTNFKYNRMIDSLAWLSLSLPMYVLAFIHVGIADQWGFYGFRSVLGFSLSISFSLYAYSYLVFRRSFLSYNTAYIKQALSLGKSNFFILLRIILPMSKYAFIAQFIVIAMECLADFGAASVFNIETLSVAIYQVWYGLFSFTGAVKLSVILFMIALMLLYADLLIKPSQSVSSKATKLNNSLYLFNVQKITPFLNMTLIIFFSFSFFLPLLQLIFWATKHLRMVLLSDLIEYSYTSFKLAFIVAIIVSIITFLQVCLSRLDRSQFNYSLNRVSLIGYAIPGAVIAVCVFLLAENIKIFFNLDIQIVLLIGLIFGLVIRFLNPSFSYLATRFSQLSFNYEKLSYSVGMSDLGIIKKLHWPSAKLSLVASSLLVFIEVIKEMPLTLMLRPFGMNTLAVKVYEFTAEGDWEKAALPALLMVVLCLSGMLVLFKLERGQKK